MEKENHRPRPPHKLDSRTLNYYRTFDELLRERGFLETTDERLNYFLRRMPSHRVMPRLGINLWVWERRIVARQTYMTSWLSMTGFRVPATMPRVNQWQYDPDLRWHFIYRDLAHPMPPANTLRRGDRMPPMRDFVERWGIDLLLLEGLLDGRQWGPEHTPDLSRECPARAVN